MSAKHPYTSSAGAVATMVQHLRKSFPNSVSSETVKKLGLAPNNESYVINALQFIGAIDEEGNKTDISSKTFNQHKDTDFEKHFEKMIKSAYSDLFDLHGEGAWSLAKDELITFFRNSDQTSAVIGGRQANLFMTFAALSGHGELKSGKSSGNSKPAKTESPAKKEQSKQAAAKPRTSTTTKSVDADTDQFNKILDVGLSVKVEVNLPADASPEAYDAIFSSIRKHLIDQS